MTGGAALSCIRQMDPPSTSQEGMHSLPSHHQAEEGHLREEGEWKQVSAWGDRQIHSQSTSPSQVPLYNRYEALESYNQGYEEMDEGSSGLEDLYKAGQEGRA